jgi:hypothetical protein
MGFLDKIKRALGIGKDEAVKAGKAVEHGAEKAGKDVEHGAEKAGKDVDDELKK